MTDRGKLIKNLCCYKSRTGEENTLEKIMESSFPFKDRPIVNLNESRNAS